MPSNILVLLEYGLVARSSNDAIRYNPYQAPPKPIPISEYKVLRSQDLAELSGTPVFLLQARGRFYTLIRNQQELPLDSDQDRERNLSGATLKILLLGEERRDQAIAYYQVAIDSFVGQPSSTAEALNNIPKRRQSANALAQLVIVNQSRDDKPVYALYYSQDGGGGGGGSQDVCDEYRCNTRAPLDPLVCSLNDCPPPG